MGEPNRREPNISELAEHPLLSVRGGFGDLVEELHRLRGAVMSVAAAVAGEL